MTRGTASSTVQWTVSGFTFQHSLWSFTFTLMSKIGSFVLSKVLNNFTSMHFDCQPIFFLLGFQFLLWLNGVGFQNKFFTSFFFVANNCSAVQYSAMQFSKMHCIAVQCSEVHCSAVHFSAEHCTVGYFTAMQINEVQSRAVQCSAVMSSAAGESK